MEYKSKSKTKTVVNPDAYEYKEGEVKTRYDRYKGDRDNYLRRGREASLFTIPSLLPDVDHTSTSELVTPFQSIPLGHKLSG